MSTGAEFREAVKADAKLDPWIDLILQIRPEANAALNLSEPLTLRSTVSGRSHMVETVQKAKLMTIAVGEHLIIIDDPMEMMLMFDAHNGFRALKAKLAQPNPDG